MIQGLGLINIFNQLLFSLMLQKRIKKKSFLKYALKSLKLE